MSSCRSIHSDERRAFLQSLPAAMESVSLPVVIPKLPTQAGRNLMHKYASVHGYARRGSELPTVFEVLMLKFQRDANITRRILSRSTSAQVTEWPESTISYAFVINVINPIGNVIGFEDTGASVLKQLTTGRNQEEALLRLCNLLHPFDAPPEPEPAAPQPSPTRAGGKRDAARAALADLTPRSKVRIFHEFGMMCVPALSVSFCLFRFFSTVARSTVPRSIFRSSS